MRALLAKADGQALGYAGPAITLRGEAWRHLEEGLKRFATSRTPVAGLRLKGAEWVEPKLTARVRHLAGQNIGATQP